MNRLKPSRRRLAPAVLPLLPLLSFLPLAIARPAHADLTGFAGFAAPNKAGQTTTVGLSVDKNTLTLTDGGKQEASSAFGATPQNVAAWRATFTYQATKFGGEGAGGGDGFAFVLQNDPRGVTALGDNGEKMGYGSNDAAKVIGKSAAIVFNLYGDSGIVSAANGVHADSSLVFGPNRIHEHYHDVIPVDLRSGHPIRVTLDYDGYAILESFQDMATGVTASNVELFPKEPVDAVGGGTARVGFTGASGDATALQTIRDFSFVSRSVAPVAQRRVVPPPPPKPVFGGALTQLVDPFIGTAGGGNVYPGAVAPFGMVQFSPDTRAHSIGYDYGNRQIEGLSLTHMSGVGCDDFGDVFLTATTGPVHLTGTAADYTSPFTHRTEAASPGYYRVMLAKPHVEAELTATVHAGVARFTFPAGQQANVWVPISHTLTFTDRAKVQVVGDREIVGEVTSKSFCGSNQSYTVYFVMQLDQPFASFGTFAGATQADGGHVVAQAEKGAPVGAWVSYPTSARERVVTARIGISFVDVAGARNNLMKEVARKSFDEVVKQTKADWERELSVIDTHPKPGPLMESPEMQTQTVFYTALYHCLLMPNVGSDADGRYRGFDNQIHTVKPGHALYANYSGWDIYRSEAPLLALIAPTRMQDMCESIALMYRQGGWIDRWPTANTYTNVMCGSPLTTVAATAWNYGLHDFDIATAYEGMYKDATQRPPGGKPYAGESNVDWMEKVGYIPDDKEGYGAVAQTEEDCIAYAALGSVAQSLGKTADAALMNKRALNYRNVFDAETKFFRPKLADGTWFAPFKPTDDHGFVEGSGWHYRFLAPQDVRGMIALFGGDDAFNAAMDEFFAYPKPGWNSRYYNPYNETDLQAPFLYDWSGAPWKTQAQVRKLLSEVYTTKPDGIPGNDDCGTMSAWAVFGMMGLYPTDPARPTLEICTPVFDRATIRLGKPYPGKTLTIETTNNHPANIYLQSLRWNGAPLDHPYVSVRDLTQGGILSFTLGAEPDKTWGAAQGKRPPSLSGQ